MKKPVLFTQTSAAVKVFTDRYPLVGPAFWIITVQYFITQIVVAMAWSTHYSLLHNTISDLGNTVCGDYAGRFVCSPLHGIMNASFIILGLTMVAGAGLIYQEFRESVYSAIGFSFMAIAGFGTVLVGLFPENTVTALHLLGATLPFFIGNIGMIILGLNLDFPRWLKLYTITLGTISLVALAFLVSHHYLGLDIGGVERITAYPQTLWLITFGVYISSSHIRRQTVSRSSEQRPSRRPRGQ